MAQSNTDATACSTYNAAGVQLMKIGKSAYFANTPQHEQFSFKQSSDEDNDVMEDETQKSFTQIMMNRWKSANNFIPQVDQYDIHAR